MVNSRSKGKRGELEAAKALAEHLTIKATRGQQRSGFPDSPDVKHSIPGIHIEVKRTEALRLRDAIKQANDDCGENIPVVMHKWNRGPWLMIVPLDRLAEFAERIVRRRIRL